MNKTVLVSLLILTFTCAFAKYGGYGGWGPYEWGGFDNNAKGGVNKQACSYALANANRAFDQVITDVKNQVNEWIIYSDLDAVNEISYYLANTCDTKNLAVVSQGKNTKADQACKALGTLLQSILEQNNAKAFRGGYAQVVKLSEEALQIGKSLGKGCEVKLVQKQAQKAIKKTQPAPAKEATKKEQTNDKGWSNIGNSIAKQHEDLAKSLNKKYENQYKNQQQKQDNNKGANESNDIGRKIAKQHEDLAKNLNKKYENQYKNQHNQESQRNSETSSTEKNNAEYNVEDSVNEESNFWSEEESSLGEENELNEESDSDLLSEEETNDLSEEDSEDEAGEADDYNEELSWLPAGWSDWDKGSAKKDNEESESESESEEETENLNEEENAFGEENEVNEEFNNEEFNNNEENEDVWKATLVEKHNGHEDKYTAIISPNERKKIVNAIEELSLEEGKAEESSDDDDIIAIIQEGNKVKQYTLSYDGKEKVKEDPITMEDYVGFLTNFASVPMAPRKVSWDLNARNKKVNAFFDLVWE